MVRVFDCNSRLTFTPEALPNSEPCVASPIVYVFSTRSKEQRSNAGKTE
jgi:hypothetical protein